MEGRWMFDGGHVIRISLPYHTNVGARNSKKRRAVQGGRAINKYSRPSIEALYSISRKVTAFSMFCAPLPVAL
jgi:hypothetical protein